MRCILVQDYDYRCSICHTLSLNSFTISSCLWCAGWKRSTATWLMKKNIKDPMYHLRIMPVKLYHKLRFRCSIRHFQFFKVLNGFFAQLNAWTLPTKVVTKEETNQMIYTTSVLSSLWTEAMYGRILIVHLYIFLLGEN